MKPCRSRRIITLEAAGRRFCKFFAGVPQNEDPIRPPYQITGQISFTTYSALNYKKIFKI